MCAPLSAVEPQCMGQRLQQVGGPARKYKFSTIASSEQITLIMECQFTGFALPNIAVHA